MAEVLVEFGDAGGIRLINEWMVDGAYGGAALDTSVTIDRYYLLEPLAKPY